jgi:DNA-directed RNA polymerase specialized sigma24 family protein
MSTSQLVTQWLDQLKWGDRDAALELWNRYFERLLGVARNKLGGTPRRVADEEDVALSALNSFYQGAAKGRFPDLQNRDGLWPLLVRITARKAVKQAAREQRLKRGGGKLRGHSALIPELRNEQGQRRKPGDREYYQPPDYLCQMDEERQRLLDLLPGELRAVAEWKLDGESNAEIAEKLQCVERTIERKLNHIRSIWQVEVDQ